MRRFAWPIWQCLLAFMMSLPTAAMSAAEMQAGVARIDITDYDAGHVHAPCYAKALVLQQDETTAVLITVDAVAIGELGRIRNDFLASVRAELKHALGIVPTSVLINASHCHGIVRPDTRDLVVNVVKQAWQQRQSVKIGTGDGREDGISENRRLLLKDGSEVDMRRAYAMPRDQDVAQVGPIDPQIGLLRIDRADGRPLAVIYNFACHPIMDPPQRGNSADFPFFASRAIEENLGEDVIALFVQGCGGDINPIRYKEVNGPSDSEPLGNKLGLSVLRAVRRIETKSTSSLSTNSETLSLPRGADLAQRIATIESEQRRLTAALKPTHINFKTFLPLLIQQRLSPEFPSHYAQSYLHDRALGKSALDQLDASQMASVEAYLKNIEIMEQLTRLATNRALLKKHLAQNQAAAISTIDVEVCALRVGDFRLVTFPGELTVQIGLNIKRAVQLPHVFVAGYTNGYIYYAPTADQRRNSGFAQEDCDSLVAPEWQRSFEMKAIELLTRL